MTSAVDQLEKVADLCSRIRYSPHEKDVVGNLLTPMAAFLGAETASFRSLSIASGIAKPNCVVSLGIPQSVDDAYLTRYHKLDPARRLLQRRLRQPIFPHPTRQGEWSTEHASAAERHRNRMEFLKYRAEFLLPNNFYHHVGFCFQNLDGKTLLFDFHRPARSAPFGSLEVASARILAMYLESTATRCTHFEAPHCVRGDDNPLSAREVEVAEAVAHGLSNKEVAATLSISVRTVENHMRSIFAKLGVTTRTRLAAKLLETSRHETNDNDADAAWPPNLN